jgi:hypothetical protein
MIVFNDNGTFVGAGAAIAADAPDYEIVDRDTPSTGPEMLSVDESDSTTITLDARITDGSPCAATAAVPWAPEW